MVPPIHNLPVELLAYIFVLSQGLDPLPDDGNRALVSLPSEAIASHVSRHWRNIALNTRRLWTTLHFRTVHHLPRARSYLDRSGVLPLDIYVDTVSEEDHVEGYTLFRAEFLPIFDILLSHIGRWRSLHTRVSDLEVKAHARAVFSRCGGAPALCKLQLWHIENWGTAERLYTALASAPVVIFDETLPSLTHISLIGVNLPWARSGFLKNLTTIDFALHSDNVRMPFTLWRDMLLNSPRLHTLALTYSGPRAAGPQGIEWWGRLPRPTRTVADASSNTSPSGGSSDLPARSHTTPARVPVPAEVPVYLPALREVRLNDLDPDYSVALFRTIYAPNINVLRLELAEQDFSSLVRYFTDPSPSNAKLVKRPPPPSQEGKGDEEHRIRAEEIRGRGMFRTLESLVVVALRCSADDWRSLLRTVPALKHLEANFEQIHPDAFAALIDADGNEPMLPELRTLRASGCSGAQLRQLREVRGEKWRLRRWEVSERIRDREAGMLEVEVERAADGVAEALREVFVWVEDRENDEEMSESHGGEHEEYDDVSGT